jgi:hypothetical protein
MAKPRKKVTSNSLVHSACLGRMRDMTAKEILLQVAETLPPNATLLDAINELEMFVAREDLAEITNSMRHAITAEKPEWLYDSPSRVTAVLRQSHRSVSPLARSFCE